MRFKKWHDCKDAGGRATQEQLPRTAVFHSEAARRARHMDVPSAFRLAPPNKMKNPAYRKIGGVFHFLLQIIRGIVHKARFKK